MNFTVYVSDKIEGNIWLSSDNRIRVLAPSKLLVPPRREWEVRLNDWNVRDEPPSALDIRRFNTMMKVIMFLLEYTGEDIDFTYEMIGGKDDSGIDRVATTWTKKDFADRTLPRTDISKRKLILQ